MKGLEAVHCLLVGQVKLAAKIKEATAVRAMLAPRGFLEAVAGEVCHLKEERRVHETGDLEYLGMVVEAARGLGLVSEEVLGSFVIRMGAARHILNPTPLVRSRFQSSAVSGEEEAPG